MSSTSFSHAIHSRQQIQDRRRHARKGGINPASVRNHASVLETEVATMPDSRLCHKLYWLVHNNCRKAHRAVKNRYWTEVQLCEFLSTSFVEGKPTAADLLQEGKYAEAEKLILQHLPPKN